MHSFFSNKGDEALAQVAQRGGGCPKVRGWGYEHLMELWVSLQEMGIGPDGLERSLPTQMILWLRLEKTTKIVLSNP